MTTLTAITGFLLLLLVITESSLQVESTLVISTDRINTPGCFNQAVKQKYR